MELSDYRTAGPVGCRNIGGLSNYSYAPFLTGGRRGRDGMIVGLTTICAISAYYH
jgi:hypothetical protein